MDETAIGNLVERIYDMALEPDLWPDLLGRLAGAFAGHAGAIEQEHAESQRGAGLTFGLDPAVVRSYFDYYAGRNVLRRFDGFQGRIPYFTPTITVDEDSLPKQELMKTEFYVDFLRPMTIHSCLTVGLWSQPHSITALSIYRPPGRPSFEGQEIALARTVHPHLVRAFRLGRKLAESRELATGLVAGLDHSALGVLVLSAEGLLRHANRTAERLLAEPGGLGVLGGRLVAADVVDTERLRALISRALASAGRVGGAISLRRSPGRAPLSLVAAPFGAERLGVLGAERGVIVCVTDPEAATTVSDVYLREGLRLTAAEANVVRALLAGRSLERTAAELDVSLFTVRAHLRSIFEKTGTRRQAELVALVAREGRQSAP